MGKVANGKEFTTPDGVVSIEERSNGCVRLGVSFSSGSGEEFIFHNKHLPAVIEILTKMRSEYSK